MRGMWPAIPLHILRASLSAPLSAGSSLLCFPGEDGDGFPECSRWYSQLPHLTQDGKGLRGVSLLPTPPQTDEYCGQLSRAHNFEWTHLHLCQQRSLLCCPGARPPVLRAAACGGVGAGKPSSHPLFPWLKGFIIIIIYFTVLNSINL